jgi:hypothetical protein
MNSAVLWNPTMAFHTAADFAGLAMRRVVPLLFSTLIACGTAAAQQPVKPKAPATAPATKPADNGKCIGVLSAIGDSINLQKIGITVFGNELEKVPVDSWQIDNLVVGKISAYLSKSWSVRPISYPKGAFATLEQDHGLFHNRDAELTEIIRRVTSSTKCDHYVVVLKGSSGYGTSNQSLYGLGVLEVGAPIMITDMLFALYVIKVYDGQTFAVLGQQRATLDENHFSSIHGPFRQLYTNFTFPQPGTAPGPAVRDGLRSLVEKSLDATMPQILRIE